MTAAPLDRVRARALHRVLVALGLVDPARLRSTWPPAARAIHSAVMAGQADAAALVESRLLTDIAAAVGLDLGWDVTGLVTPAHPAALLAARLAATPDLVSARVAAGADQVDAFTQSATWVTQVAGSAVHETARAGAALASSALPTYSGWRWDPEAGACPWCRMQASRGAVFRRETVRHSHAHCRCDAVEVLDRDEAHRIAVDGRQRWADMVATGDVPASARRLPKPGTGTAGVNPGARTPQRLVAVRTQIDSYRRHPATGARARTWQQQKLAELERELAGLLIAA